MKEALFYTTRESILQCCLCPHNCEIDIGDTGRCKVRRNVEGKLHAETWGRVSAIHSDPIEKKPLYHFHPGKRILSVGTVGCNLSCKFCQNCQISQSSVEDLPLLSRKSPEEVVSEALAIPENIGIAFTYNEPTVWIEYVLDIARLAKEKGLKTVMVSNGFINPEPLEEVIEVIDAFNIDLKSFSEEFYRRITFSTLEPVKQTIQRISGSGRHLELTNLVIPGLNDDADTFTEMLEWIRAECGEKTVLHISRYFPNHRLNLPPTPMSTLKKLFAKSKEYLPFVYLGNVGYEKEGRDTYCSSCHSLSISREAYHSEPTGLDARGNCLHCHERIAVR